MIRAKNLFVCIFIVLSGAIAAIGQEEGKPTVASNTTWTRVDPLGGVTLPTGFTYVRTKNWVDAWYGVIESNEQEFAINIAAGMVESGTSKDKKKLIWQKTVQVKVYPDQDARPVLISLFKKKKKQLIYAAVGWAKFSAYVKDTSEQATFISIVSSYRSLQRATKQP